MDRLNMDCRHRAGFTCRLSRLKHRALEKMGSFITNNEDFFLSSLMLSVQNRTSKNVYSVPFFLFFQSVLSNSKGPLIV